MVKKMYKEDCPNCVGDGYYDCHCPYCDDNIPFNEAFPNSERENELMSPILKCINDTGFYWHVPNNWDKNGEEVQKLLSETKIVSIKIAGIKFINEDYCFILTGNPDNVRVKNKDSWSFLISDKTNSE